MAIITPFASNHDALDDLHSRYVTVDALPWQPTKYDGVEMKVLMIDEDTGMMTALFRWAPGSELPFHEHVEIEQTYVLEGSFEDEHGHAKAGEFVWRPAGSRHTARSPEGAVVLSWFMRPNKFFDQEDEDGWGVDTG